MIQAIAFLIAACVLAAQTTANDQSRGTTDVPPASIALVTTYADGRTQYDLVSARPASFWTSNFPRIAGPRAPDGKLPVTALQISRQLVGQDVRVTVSVLRGSPHQEEDLVATVMLSSGTHVLVTELRGFGIEPVDVSLADAAPMVPFLPSVLSVTSDLEISAVDLKTAPYPGYRIVLRNLSSKSIANFHVQSYRGSQMAISAVPREKEGRPAMEPGGSFSFDVNLTSWSAAKGDAGVLSPAPLDRIEIDSVVYGDGTIVGDNKDAAAWRAIPSDSGRRFTLTRAIDILRRAQRETATPQETLAAIERAFQALPNRDDTRLAAAQASMREAKSMVLDDLHRFEQDETAARDPDRVRAWIHYTSDRYERWIKVLPP